MNTIFDNLNANIDLSIFGKDNPDPKTALRRRYLSLAGLLEYVDIINGDLTGRELPEGMDEDTVKRMVTHSIGDLDTVSAMAQGTQGTQGTQGVQGNDEGTQGVQGTQGNDEGTQGTQGNDEGTQGNDEGTQGNDEGTQGNDEGTQGNDEGTQGNDEGTQGVQGE